MKAFVVIMTIFFASGCSKTATIYKKDGTVIEGKIERSDALTIYVEPDGWNDDCAIERAEIVEINHPGDLEAIVCTVFALVGAASTVWAFSEFEQSHSIVGFNYLFVGIPSLLVFVSSTGGAIWGFYTWVNSRSAANATSSEPTGQKIIPAALPYGERTYWGLGMSWSW